MKKKNNTQKYSLLIGILKTVKNSAYLLVPFIVAVLSGLPSKYAIFTGPVVYFIKNYFQNK